MASQSKFLLFGDQTSDNHQSLVKLYNLSKGSLALSQFFSLSTYALRYGVANLETRERAWFPSFTTLLDLSKAQSLSSYKHPPIATVLLTIAQLGLLIVAMEKDSQLLESSSEMRFVGLCTGGLAAVAAASVTSVTELLRLVPEFVRISLRLGIAASQRSRSIESSKGNWAIVVNHHSFDEMRCIIENFHQSEGIPIHKAVYISASFDTALTLSGPPSTLRLLRSTMDDGAYGNVIELPIAAAYHANHLDIPDIAKIVGPSLILHEKLPRQRVVISPADGHELDRCSTISAALHEVIVDILGRCLDWRSIICSHVVSPNAEDSTMVVVGAGNAAKSLEQALKPSSVLILDRGILSESPLDLGDSTGQIAIVGMAGRFAGSDTLEQFWEILETGRDLHRKVPSNRFDVKTHCDPSGTVKNTTLTPYGCFYDNLDLFDEKMFDMSPREASQSDPGQRLQLATAYEALEMSGYSFDGTPSTHHSRIGTFFGQSSDDWWTVQAAQDIDTFHITGGSRAFGPGRVSYHFGWEGPSIVIDTACSSSAVAIKMACASLNARECDTALAGGANILTGSDVFAGLSRAGFISTTGSCKTFDASADGYCRADAVATLVLKRLEDAIADRDNIQAVIRAAVSNHSAEAVSLTRPHAPSLTKLFNQLLVQAGIGAGAIDYVEMHGTGTQHGDVTESRSVADVFAEGHDNERPLYIGTAKPNVGHGEAASGVTSVIKAALMFRKNCIPPHSGIKTTRNAQLPHFEALDIEIPAVKKAFVRDSLGDGIRRIVVNNYNAAGGNTTMLVEDRPPNVPSGQDPRTSHIIALSAKTPNSLKGNMERLLMYLNDNPHTRVQDLGYTTTARRMHHPLRKAFTVRSTQELTFLLQAEWKNVEMSHPTSKAVSAAFVFTGQASQYATMGHQLFDTSAFFRDKLKLSEQICRKLGFPSILNAFLDERKAPTSDPVVSQLALIAMEVALAELWQSHGINPNVMIGHSLGEYAAMCIAGVISLTDMFYLVGHRAQLMQEHCTVGSHAMLVTNTDLSRLKRMIADWNMASCEIACCNGPDSTSVSGPIEKLESLRDRLKQLGWRAALLQVPYAFHSAQVEPILEKFGDLAQAINFSQPSIPIVSTLLGKAVSEPGIFGANYLVKQTREAVQFSLAVAEAQALAQDQIVWIEIGPGSSCLTMVRSILGLSADLTLPSLSEGEDDWMCVSKGLATAYTAGLPVEWKSFHEPYKDALCLLDLPRYAFDNKSHWIDYNGDWSITKSHGQREPANHMLSNTGLSPALHKLAAKTFSATKLSLSFTRDQLKEKFYYLVNGWAILPVSMIADIAYGAARYIWKSMNPKNVGNDLAKLSFPSFSPKGLEQQFKSILARETRIPLNEIQPHVAFANLGVDSLLGISITAAVKGEMGLSLPPSFFIDNVDVNDAMEFLESITSKPQAI